MWPWRSEWGAILGVLRPVRLGDFFSALPQERPYCIACLARLSTLSETTVRRELQAMTGRIESRVTRCGTCEESTTTYRLVA